MPTFNAPSLGGLGKYGKEEKEQGRLCKTLRPHVPFLGRNLDSLWEWSTDWWAFLALPGEGPLLM